MRVRLVVVELFPPPTARFKVPIILSIHAVTDDIHTQIPIDKPRRRRLKNSMLLFVYRTIPYYVYEYKIPKNIRLEDISSFGRSDC